MEPHWVEIIRGRALLFLHTVMHYLYSGDVIFDVVCLFVYTFSMTPLWIQQESA